MTRRFPDDGRRVGTSKRQPLGVAVAGFGWMGRVHTQAYARMPHHFPQLPPVAAAGRRRRRGPRPGRRSGRAQFGFGAATVDWRDLLDDPASRPSASPRRTSCTARSASAMARPASTSGSRSPSGSTPPTRQPSRDAVEAAGVQSAVGFNYRNAPAVEPPASSSPPASSAPITHARFRLLSDYAAHPDGALSWRFERERGGNGVLGDLASHGVDLARYLLGDIDVAGGRHRHLHPDGPRPTGATSGHAAATGGELGAGGERGLRRPACCGSPSGARGTLEASRVAVGEQNNYGFEIHGTKGAVFWDFRRMGELGVEHRHLLPGPAGAAPCSSARRR